jgi:hypothetical protein
LAEPSSKKNVPEILKVVKSSGELDMHPPDNLPSHSIFRKQHSVLLFLAVTFFGSIGIAGLPQLLIHPGPKSVPSVTANKWDTAGNIVAKVASESAIGPLIEDTSSPFGLPVLSDLNQAGDYAFLGTGATALFLRPAAGRTIQRVIQLGDPIPGIPASRVDIVGSPRLNNSGKLAFVAQFNTNNGSSSEYRLRFGPNC